VVVGGDSEEFAGGGFFLALPQPTRRRNRISVLIQWKNSILLFVYDFSFNKVQFL
jgi:hypothetical protein